MDVSTTIIKFRFRHAGVAGGPRSNHSISGAMMANNKIN